MIRYVDKDGLTYYTSKIKGIINDTKSLGRFLSNWSCKTGMPTTNPPGTSVGDSFTYRSGDYYLVSEVADSGQSNYRPSGSSYIVGSASSAVETDEVAVGDIYIYDSQNWLLLYNTRKTIAFSNVSGSPYDNTNLAAALNGKQDELVQGTGIAIDTDTNTISNSGVRGISTGSTNGTISVNTNGTSAEVAVAGLGSAAYTASSNYATSTQGGKADTAIQDVQVDGTSVVTSGVANIDLTGYELKGSVVALSATDSITVADNTYYTGGTQTALTVTVPVSGMDISFISQICFRSGATATTFTESAGDIVWDERSVDLVQGVFVPDVNKDYTVIIYYNGFSFVGIASGVANA